MIKMSFNMQMVKHTVLYPYHRKLLSDQKKLFICETI